jgi:surfactin synthase thioesterase subunit
MDAAHRWAYRSAAPDKARARLFCLPFAGGSAVAYRQWRSELPSDVDVVPLELSGRGARMSEAPIDAWPELLADLAETVAPLADRPYAFFGYSLGGLVGFELARALRSAGHRLPEHLFVAAARAPAASGDFPAVSELPRDAFVAEVVRFGGMTPEVLATPELVDLVLPILRADLRLAERYTVPDGQPLACPITAFSGGKDPEVTLAHLRPWREATTARFRIELFPEQGHFFLETMQRDILRVVRAILVS